MARKKASASVESDLPPTVPEPTPAAPPTEEVSEAEASTKAALTAPSKSAFRIRIFKDIIVEHDDENAVRQAALAFRAQSAPESTLLVEPTTEPATGRWVVREGAIVLEPQVFDTVEKLKAHKTFMGDAARVRGEEEIYTYQPQFTTETIVQAAQQLGIPPSKDGKTAIVSNVQGMWVNSLFMQELQRRLQQAQQQQGSK